MSSRQLENRQEREQIEWIASEVGLTVEELTELDFDLDAMDGNDGAVYGHVVTFGEDSDPGVLAKVDGLQDGRWVQIGFPPSEPEPDFED